MRRGQTAGWRRRPLPSPPVRGLLRSRLVLRHFGEFPAGGLADGTRFQEAPQRRGSELRGRTPSLPFGGGVKDVPTLAAHQDVAPTVGALGLARVQDAGLSALPTACAPASRLRRRPVSWCSPGEPPAPSATLGPVSSRPGAVPGSPPSMPEKPSPSRKFRVSRQVSLKPSLSRSLPPTGDLAFICLDPGLRGQGVKCHCHIMRISSLLLQKYP